MTPWTPWFFAWQAWHLVTSTFTLRGRRGTWWHRPSLCVAGVAVMALGWLWWRDWFPDYASHTHTTCSHTTCSHTTCPHTTCPHTTCPHTTCPHMQLAHRQLAHTQLVHTQFVHAHSLLTHNLLTHGSLLHTPILHHLFSLSWISHAIFTCLLLLVGRSWHVGLSGPLITQSAPDIAGNRTSRPIEWFFFQRAHRVQPQPRFSGPGRLGASASLWGLKDPAVRDIVRTSSLNENHTS